MKKRSNKKDYGITGKPCDVRPLNQRESKSDTRKGMLKVKRKGIYDATDYVEQLIFGNRDEEQDAFDRELYG